MLDGDCMCWSLRWDEISRVVAFKLNRMSYDTICFGFQRRDELNQLWCIEEDWPGYKRIVPEIERLTQGSWPTKFEQVAKPVFEFNWTKLWSQPDAPKLGDDPILIWFSPPEKTDPNA